MYKLYICVVFRLFCCEYLDVYHVNSVVTFMPDDSSEYFGYTVVLNAEGELIVGAPKAKNRLTGPISSGQIFICPTTNLRVKNITCRPLGTNNKDRDVAFSRFTAVSNFFKDDMWFGATIAVIPNGKILVCAPRLTSPYNDKFLLANGGCYVQGGSRISSLYPLKERDRQAFMTDGSRKEYGEYGSHLNFYAYGQAGFSVKVTENNSFIIGAPGILQWSGGIVEYKFYPDYDTLAFSKQPTINPYFTKDVGPDDYLGYSVESGVFEENGTTLFVAGAPRSKQGYGLVLIFKSSFRETDPLNIKAKVRGPQLGAYFGASLCCADINGDGVTDLLVGAPNFVKKDGGLPYDQGAVFVYITVRQGLNFTLKAAGYVFGSGESGARFGSTIAHLGDIDGDGFNDIAVGAPWEKFGRGTVYIYKGSKNGLRCQFIQKITIEDAKGFGISISRGLDVDTNNCNDLAIGAHNIRKAYIFRCIPTLHVQVAIKVPDAMNLQQNATNFTALFCVSTKTSRFWPNAKMDLITAITIDPEGNRAKISGDSNYNVVVKPGNENCDEQVVEVKPTADLSKPISIKFSVERVALLHENSSTFPHSATRISEDSILDSSFEIQLTRDCGEDLICRPLLQMSLQPLNNPYVPGSNDRLGVKVIVLNKKEPSYGAKVYLILPSSPKRLPSECSLQENNVTCNLPAPLYRLESIEWDIEVEHTNKDSGEEKIIISAELDDPFNNKINNKSIIKDLIIQITPKARFSVSGKALPNVTVTVTRDKLYGSENVTFVHYFEVTNFGPSDWYHLPSQILLSEKVNLTNLITGCSKSVNVTNCDWMIPAKVSKAIVLPLFFDLSIFGDLLRKQGVYNISTKLILGDERNRSVSITTTLILEPAQPYWPIIVGCIFGLILLMVIVIILHRYGFFLRNRYEELKGLKKDTSSSEEASSSKEILSTDESVEELITDDSD